MNDPIYKNKVRFYRVLLMENYTPNVAAYRNRAISLFYALQPHIGANDNAESALKSIEGQLMLPHQSAKAKFRI